MLNNKMGEHNFQRQKNTISKISLAKILFEDDGGGGGVDAYERGGEVSFKLGGGYGGGYGGGGVINAFVEPFKNLLQGIGYGVEKISNAGYYFAKKILVNIPRLFNPATPLIFDDIKDEEKAAYQRLDKRYASMLQNLQRLSESADVKAFSFLLNPARMLSLGFITKGPVVSYRLLNTMSGNKISDLVTNIRDAYNSLPAQQRSRDRIDAIVRRYEQADAAEAARKAARGTPIKSGSPGYGYGYSQYSQYNQQNDPSLSYADLNENTNLPIEDLNAEFLPIAIELFPEKFQQILGPEFEKIKKQATETLETIVSNTENQINNIKNALNSKTPENYSKATGVNINEIISLVNSNINTLLKDTPDVENLEPEKQKNLKAAIEIGKKQIKDNVLKRLKEDYKIKQNPYLNSVVEKFQQMENDPNIDNTFKSRISEVLKQVNELLK